MRNDTGWLSKTLALVLVSASGVLLSACYADGDVGEIGDENTAQVEAAFGEATCANTAIADYTHTGDVDCYDNVPIHSPSTGYGQAACTAAWVVDADGTYEPYSTTVKPFFYSVEDINTADECARASTHIRRYSSSGTVLGERDYHGAWDSGSSTCSLVENDNEGNLEVETGDRFIVQGYRTNMLAPRTYLRVTLRFFGPAC